MLHNRRGYHGKDAEAAPKTRLDTLDAVERRQPRGAGNDMDTSSSISGTRPRDLGEPPPPETPVMGTNGRRVRGDALATVPAADMSVVQEHA